MRKLQNKKSQIRDSQKTDLQKPLGLHNQYLITIIILLILTSILVIHAFHFNFLSDDAFIIARYAHNVVEGNGWVYNINDRIEGYSSFVWTAMTVFFGYLGFDYIFIIRALSLLSAIGCLFITWWISPKIGIERYHLFSLIAPSIICFSSIFACWSLGGLETCFYSFMILMLIYLLGKENPTMKNFVITGILAGVCSISRIEGIFIPIACSVWLIIFRSEKSKQYLMWFIYIALPIFLIHLLWRKSYYGFWLPNIYYTKIGHNFDQIYRGLKYVHQAIIHNGGYVAWLIPFIFVWFVPQKSYIKLISLVGLFLLAEVIYVGGDGLPMYRFVVPVIPLWGLLIAYIINFIWKAMKEKTTQSATTFHYVENIAAIILVCCIIIPVVIKPTDSFQYIIYSYQKNVQLPQWTAVGKWLAENAPSDSSIACVPIGAVGYYSKLKVWDILGLTDKHIAHLDIKIGKGWAGHEKHDGGYILQQKPTYLLLGNIQVLNFPLPLDHPEFCRPQSPDIQEWEGDFFQSGLINNYEKKVKKIGENLYLHFFQLKPSE